MSASGLQAVHRRSAPLLTLSQDRSMAAAAVVQPPSPAEAKVAQGDATTATTATTATAATAATAALPFLATDASDISTVTRPRSTTSSCNSAPLSTLPSSTSPPLLSVKPHRPHPHSHHHHHHHRLQPHASSPEPLDQRFLAAAATPPPVPPHTSLRPLRVRPPSQLQSSFRSASEQQPLSSFRSASEQQQQQQQQQQQPLAAAPSYYRPYLSDDGQADDVAPSVNSQDLAWDQTRLRIAYLVSTMVVPGGGGGGCGYGYGHPFGYGYSPRGSADVPPSPTSPGRADMGCFPAGSTGGGHRGSIGLGLGPESAQDRCPEGWPGVDPVKKRRRIAQLRRWADEIAALDDQDQTFCGCVVGTPMPPYDVPESAETSAATSTVAVAVAVGPETSDETSPVQALPGRCDGCGHRLTPVRPYVFVDDSGMPKTRDGATRTLRRAYKSIRDLVSRVKEQSAKESAAKAEVPGAGNTPPLSPKQQHAFNRRLSRMRPWDQWHELNCNYTAGDFFTQTTMYHGHATPAPPDTNATRPPPPWLHAGAFGHDRQPPTSAAAMAAVAAATAAAAVGELDQDATPHKRATAQTTTSDSESSSTSSRDSGPVNMEARRRRQQRHLDARIRRAQLLLASTNNAAPPPPPAAVGTQQ